MLHQKYNAVICTLSQDGEIIHNTISTIKSPEKNPLSLEKHSKKAFRKILPCIFFIANNAYLHITRTKTWLRRISTFFLSSFLN